MYTDFLQWIHALAGGKSTDRQRLMIILFDTWELLKRYQIIGDGHISNLNNTGEGRK